MAVKTLWFRSVGRSQDFRLYFMKLFNANVIFISSVNIRRDYFGIDLPSVIISC